MSEGAEGADRPHEATAKRVEDALKRGDTPNAREPAIAGSLLAFAALLATSGERIAADLASALAPLWRGAGLDALATGDSALALMREVCAATGAALAPPLAALAAGALLPTLAQGPRVAAKRIAPKPSHLSPLKGLKRLFGPAGWVEFAKAVTKMLAVGAIAGWAVWSGTDGMAGLARAPDVAVATALGAEAARLALLIAAMTVPLAVADVAWSRQRWRRQLRMTDEEMRRENKDSDGDPATRARRQSLRRDRARRGSIARVDEADLLIVNPTHVAVALAYDRARHAAPVVVAKGRDHVALRMRARAEANGVPLFEEPPLARAL